MKHSSISVAKSVTQDKEICYARNKTSTATLSPELELVLSRKNFHTLVEDPPRLSQFSFPLTQMATPQSRLQRWLAILSFNDDGFYLARK